MSQRIVIVGGGHAASQLCASLREGGFDGTLILCSDEPLVPYHRPPLSKTYVKDENAAPAPIRGDAFYHDGHVELRLGDRVTGIDPQRRCVNTASGAEIGYDRLVLATGARARRLSGVAPDAPNVCELRNLADAQKLRDTIRAASAVTVLGGGFIGLEIAATSRAMGKDVTVLELAPRLLARAVSPEVSDHLLTVHRESGVDIRLGVRVERFEFDATGRVTGVVVEGRSEPVELLVIGIGAEPETALAQAAGLACGDGVLVDAHMQTSDPAIYAIGDCTSFPRPGGSGRLRLESVQNAHDQARCAALALLGRPEAYAATPWFWSDQGSVRLQIAGLTAPDTERVLRPGKRDGSFSVLHYAGDALVAVESVNNPADHMASRLLIGRGISPERSAVTDPEVALKTFLPPA